MKTISNLLSYWGLKASFIPAISFLIAFAIILVIAYAAHILFKIYIHRQINKFAKDKKNYWSDAILGAMLVRRLSHLVPALIIYAAVPLLSASDLSIDETLIRFIQAVMLLYILGAFVLVVNSIIQIGETVHRKQKGKKRRSIKSYVQVVRIVVYFLAAIVAVGIILNKSPIALFTGLFAMSAVISFVFKDEISGFISSVKISSYDMVRVGDWIVLPKYGADGDVLEISLSTVKIQNFDKTITTIPTYALLSEGVTNWRGMTDSGGRRIKRSLVIDVKTIKFCEEGLISKLSNISFLKSHIQKKKEEYENGSKDEASTNVMVESKHYFTNVGLFRAYIENYLNSHPKIHKEYTFLIRHLESSEYGLPLQIYIFTNDTNWNNYEAIQADIFEHIFSIIKEFDLALYQR